MSDCLHTLIRKNEGFFEKKKNFSNICENNDIIYATGGY